MKDKHDDQGNIFLLFLLHSILFLFLILIQY
jgi:hypothetical protein